MINEVIKAIKERRSVRAYKSDPVDEAVLDVILSSGSFAPTANGTQAWHITAVVGKERINELNLRLKEASVVPGFDRYAKLVQGPYSVNFKNAPVLVIVGSHRTHSIRPVEDATLVLSNILLAAHALGLGACWVNQLGAVGEEPGFRSYLTTLGFPETHLIIGAAAIGHPSGSHPKAAARKPGQINVIR